MTIKTTTVGIFATALLGLGCEPEVNDELEDLREARAGADAEVKELRQELTSAKAEVKRLEEKLTLAKQGVTDEVLEERRELSRALEEQRQNVSGEISEAQKEAQQHNKQTEAAQKALEETQPPDVTAEVKSQAKVKANEGEVRTNERKTDVTVKSLKGDPAEQEKPSEKE